MDLPPNAFKRGLRAGEAQIGLWSSLSSNYSVMAETMFRCGVPPHIGQSCEISGSAAPSSSNKIAHRNGWF